jgi:hypothetical protein
MIEGMKAVGRRGVFGYFEGCGPNMQYPNPNDAYRIIRRPLKRVLRPRISVNRRGVPTPIGTLSY